MMSLIFFDSVDLLAIILVAIIVVMILTTIITIILLGNHKKRIDKILRGDGKTFDLLKDIEKMVNVIASLVMIIGVSSMIIFAVILL